MTARLMALAIGVALLTATAASAAEEGANLIPSVAATATPIRDAARAAVAASDVAVGDDGQDSAPPPPAAEYSDAYRLRGKIHRIASFATLPLFATEGYLGQSLYNEPSSTKKSAHLAVASAMGGLFAVNSVTGVWNLLEARKDPNGRKRRLVHGILMLAADGGFLATAMLGPESEHGLVEGSRSAHREPGARDRAVLRGDRDCGRQRCVAALH
ncbi:MAG: hypothetical protein ABL982_24595, partial [Vicinamibacterales bacterium]